MSPESIGDSAVAEAAASGEVVVGATGAGVTSPGKGAGEIVGEAVGEGDIASGEIVGEGDIASGEIVGEGDIASGEIVGEAVGEGDIAPGEIVGEAVGEGDIAPGEESPGEGLGGGDASWAKAFVGISPTNRHTEIRQAARNFFNTYFFLRLSS